MIDLSSLLSFYPQQIAANAAFHKHVLKEYVELLALEHLMQSPFAPKLVFIGGTNLRLVYGIDRFSEDLDFDCKGLTSGEFISMTASLAEYLRLQGLKVELRDKENPKLTAYRRNIFFPELLFEMNLTGHREERFLMKIEAQDQGVDYIPQTALVNRCGFFFPVTVPSKETLLAMKLLALLARAKGRDFYDTIFLWQQTNPDFDFLKKRNGIENAADLRKALMEKLDNTNLAQKQKDFEHLLFNSARSAQILHFREFVEGKISDDGFLYANEIEFNGAKAYLCEGLAEVEIGEKYGYIDKDKNLIINAVFDDAYPFSNGNAPVEIDGKWGLIDKTGKFVIEPKYDDITTFAEGLAIVDLQGKSGYINRQGEIVIPIVYEQASVFRNGVALVSLDGKSFYYIDNQGKKIRKCE